jgi:uncharacterized membrane protein
MPNTTETRNTPPVLGLKRNRHNLSTWQRWASVIGGAGLAAWGLTKRDRSGIAVAWTGAALMYRGNSGHCMARQVLGMRPVPTPVISIKQQQTVNVSAERAYEFWRDPSNLPRFMTNLARVQDLGGGRSRWTYVFSGGLTREHDAQLVVDKPEHSLVWRSIDNPSMDVEARVHFVELDDDRGTELHVRLSFLPAGGLLVETAMRAMRWLMEQKLREDLRRAKQLLETGEIATTLGQTSGRASYGRRDALRPRSIRNPSPELPASAMG